MRQVLLLCSTLALGCTEAHTVTVFAAASMGRTLDGLEEMFERAHPRTDMRAELSGSRVACAKVADQGRRADLVFAADEELLRDMLVPDHASFALRFARSALVIAFHPEGNAAARFREDEPWQRVLASEDVAIGWADPEIAPVGYRTLMAMQLNDRVAPEALRLGEMIRARLERRHRRPDVSKLLAPLQSGQLDVAFIYRSEAEQHELPYVELDPRIDFRSLEHRALYREAAVTLPAAAGMPERTLRGSPAIYGATMPRDAAQPELARALLELLLSDRGAEIARDAHLDRMSLDEMSVAGDPPPWLRATLR